MMRFAYVLHMRRAVKICGQRSDVMNDSEVNRYCRKTHVAMTGITDVYDLFEKLDRPMLVV